MAFVAQSITAFYDKRQDRLNLLFIDESNNELLSTVTRRLLKNLFTMLPEWLVKQVAQTQSMPELQKINQFHHQAAQQSVAVRYNSVQINSVLKPFLIHAISLTRQKGVDGRIEEHEQVKVTLKDELERYEVILLVTRPQLHKLMGEILLKVEGWGLVNPWGEHDVSSDLSAKNTISVH